MNAHKNKNKTVTCNSQIECLIIFDILWKCCFEKEINDKELMEFIRGDTVIYICNSKDFKIAWKIKMH